MAASERSPLLPTSCADDAANDSSFSTRVGDEFANDFIDLEGGQSTFYHALWNALGDLVGTGLLATPLAIAYCGWFVGPLLLLLLGFITHRTLLIMVEMALSSGDHTYVGIISKAFQSKFNIKPWLSSIFIFEVVAWTIALLLISGDTLNALLPQLTSNEYKIIAGLVIFPLTFLPMHLISYSSFLGILSSAVLIAIVFINGFTTHESPGSILHPVETDLWPSFGLLKFGVATGLLMSSWGGHAIMPTIIMDMKEPEKWRRLVDVSYLIALAASGGVGVAGYLMFGRDCSDEISLDLARLPGSSIILTKLAVWMVALNPLTKVPLGLRMLNDLTEIALSIEPTPQPRFGGRSRRTTPASSRPSSPAPPKTSSASTRSSVRSKSRDDTIILTDKDQLVLTEWRTKERAKGISRVLTRAVLMSLLVFISIAFPSFEALMGFLGSVPAFLLSVIVPILGKKCVELALDPSERSSSLFDRSLDWALVVVGVVGAGLGFAGTMFSDAK